jgi:group II intron reverse transcriptase/maturase/CRISPR-associated endonuclease Cas2
MMYVFVYDISNDRRRTRLHKKLLNYGTPVQLSVFEVSERYYDKALALCQTELKRDDHVRIYRLCKRCEDAAQTFGTTVPILKGDELPAIIEVPKAPPPTHKTKTYSLTRGPLEIGQIEAYSHLMEMVGNMENLNEAFLDVKANRGCAGSDGMSLAAFDRNRSFHLAELQQELLKGTYRPKALKVFSIPKGNGESRILKVPSVRDRVAQQAVLRVIGPVWERELEDASYAYRKGRSVKQAVNRVARYRDEGRRTIIRADIEDYFDEIPHDLMMERFKEKIKDDQILELVDHWISTPVDHLAPTKKLSRGIPQGSVVSPLLSNIYLDRFDEAIAERGYEMVRYADDFLVACKDAREAKDALADIKKELATDSLRLNDEKTILTDYQKGFTFLGYLFIGNFVMKKSKVPAGWKISSGEG